MDFSMTNYPFFSPPLISRNRPRSFSVSGGNSLFKLVRFHLSLFTEESVGSTVFLLQYIFLEVFQIFCIRVR